MLQKKKEVFSVLEFIQDKLAVGRLVNKLFLFVLFLFFLLQIWFDDFGWKKERQQLFSRLLSTSRTRETWQKKIKFKKSLDSLRNCDKYIIYKILSYKNLFIYLVFVVFFFLEVGSY